MLKAADAYKELRSNLGKFYTGKISFSEYKAANVAVWAKVSNRSIHPLVLALNRYGNHCRAHSDCASSSVIYFGAPALELVYTEGRGRYGRKNK